MVKIYYLYEVGVGHPMYIGSTKQSLKLRRENHLSDHRGNTKVKEWIKHIKGTGVGLNLGIMLIENCDENVRYIREEYWTKVLNTPLNIKFAQKHTQEHKLFISERLKGLKRSEKTKMKIKEGQKKVAVNIDGVDYVSIHEASRQTKISCGQICSVLRGYKKSKLHSIKYVN